MKNRIKKYSIAVFACVACALLQGCSGSIMKAERADTERVMEAVLKATQALTPEEAAAAERSDEGKEVAFKKMFVDPIENSGYDFDKSLRLFAQKYTEKDFTPEEGQVIADFLPFYVKSASDLERYGLVSSETAEALRRVRFHTASPVPPPRGFAFSQASKD